MAERFASWWRNLARDGLPPNSLAAFTFALACVCAAVLVCALFDLFGGDVLLYTIYYPAILLASLAGGAAAGFFATFLSLAIVLSAFSAPVVTQAANIILFLLSSSATIAVAELYRGASRRLHDEEKKRILLMRELEHRGKNTFAIVQSIVKQTLHDRKDAADTIVGRIRSVSATNDIITKSEHQTAGLRTILERELDPYDRARVSLRGPEVQLNAELARSFALIIHELATNAAKYGSLREPHGRLSVEWALNGEQLSLDWNETDGAALTAPFEPGFGTRLVTRLVKAHRGDIIPDFRSDGLRVRITVPMPADRPAA